MLIVRTDRLLIREYAPADAGAMEGVFLDPEVMRYGIGVQRADWVPGWIERRRNDYLTYGYGLWAVVRVEDEQVLGYCGLTFFPDIDGSPEVEVGYRLTRRFWGKGYATEAAAAVRDYTFDTLGVERLVAIVDADNTASIGVARKLGMAYENDIQFPGSARSDRLYVTERPI